MNNSLATLNFFDDPIAELNRIQADLRLEKTIQKKLSGEEAKKVLEQLAEMFSVKVPEVTDPISTLKQVAHSYHLSKLLREKALVSLFRLVHLQKIDGLPAWVYFDNPDTNERFQDDTAFVIWFCRDAYITQATAFQRLSTYKKLLQLGFSLEEAFEVVLAKPFLIRNALNLLAQWNRDGVIENIDSATVLRLAENAQVPTLAELKKSVEQYDNAPSPEGLKKIIDAYTPILKDTIEEVANIPNTRDASDYIRQDLTGTPDITYTIEEGGTLIITIVMREISTYPNGKTETDIRTIRVPFVPQTSFGVPTTIIRDLLNRLPITNRRQVESYISQMEAGKFPELPF